MRTTQVTRHVGLVTTYMDGLTLRCLGEGVSSCNPQLNGS